MPAYTGLRSRPSIYTQRQGSARSVVSQAFVESVPKQAVFPALAFVVAVLLTGTSWILDLHTTSIVAEIDASVATGSIKPN